MSSKINWLFDENRNFLKTERGYHAVISGTASGGPYTLTVTYLGPSANGDSAPVSAPVTLPAPTDYDSAKLAKQAFRVFLRDVPVTA